MRRKDPGFTLIELLVVIAIIALLAAILLPVFASAREKARQSTCANNMKQIGVAVIAYVQDYDEVFPLGFAAAPDTSGNYQSWALLMQPYVRSMGVFTCPDDSVPPDSSMQGTGSGSLTRETTSGTWPVLRMCGESLALGGLLPR